MPLLEFKCHECGRTFVIRTDVEDMFNVKTTCPQCRGDKVSRVVSFYRSVNSACECDYEECKIVAERERDEE
jgi:putative FmdB family regulatory protein